MAHILDVLDGIGAAQQDLPPGTVPDQRDAFVARIGLLLPTPNQTPPDFIDHVIFHLNSIVEFPKVSSDVRQHVQHIINAISYVQTLLQKVRSDAKALAPLNDQQLLQPSSLALLDDMESAAENAYTGQIDPFSGQLIHEGVQQIYNDIQHLAVFQLSSGG